MKQIKKPQRLTRHFVAFATASLLGSLSLGCASTQTSDIRVHSAADKKANIKAYKSYAWYESDQLIHDRTGVWVPKDVDTQAEVEFLVNDTLRKRGLTEVQGEPDLLVSVLIVADIRDVEEIKNKRGEGVTTFDPVGQGALLIELIDSETGKTVWLGGAEGDVRESRTAAESKERLAYAVDKLFDELP
jgi:hypothetical protein